MALNGKALLAGLCSVNPNSYGGTWTGEAGCWGCELDVDNMENLLAPMGYDIDILKTADATKENILAGLNDAASELKAGDIFVYYFSGHGGQQPDLNGDEMDGHDETQCAYNGELIDDRLNDVWLKFRAGVRIVMISDSCNSGTVYKDKKGKMAKRLANPTPIIPITDFEVSLAMRAKLIHFGGCRDGFGSTGYMTGGAFTIALCNAWDNGNFVGNYPDFHAAICARISSSQNPQYAQYGSGLESFRNQKPFSISTLIVPPPYYEYELVIPEWLIHIFESWMATPAVFGGHNTLPRHGVKGGNVVVRLKQPFMHDGDTT